MTVNDIVQRVTRTWRSWEWLHSRTLGKDSALQIVSAALQLVMGFAFARAGIFGGYKPFSIGLTAASGGGLSSFPVLLGAILGHITGDPFDLAMKYIGTCVLVYSFAAILRDSEIGKNRWLPSVIAGAITAGIGFIYISGNGWSFHGFLLEALEVIIAAASALGFQAAFLRTEREQLSETMEAVSFVAIFTVLCIALEKFCFFGFISVGRIIAVLFLLLASSKCGAAISCTLGFALGIGMDAGLGNNVFYSVALGVGGLIAGAVGKKGRLFCGISLVLTCAVSVIWTEESAGIIYECFISGVIFLTLPDFIAARVSALFPIQVSGCGAIKAREYTRNRVEQMALAFGELYDSVITVPDDREPKSEAAGIFDKAADSVCRLCPDSSRCWEKESERTLGVMESISPKMFSRGSVSITDFPKSFIEMCPYLNELTGAINQELRVMMYRRQYRSKLKEKRGAVYNQYADVSSVLKSLAGELGNELTFEPELERKLKKYLAGLNIEANAAVFRDKGGRLRAEIYGDGIAALKSERDYLEKLSAVLGTRLCTGNRRRQDNRMLFLEAEPLAVSVGIAAVKRRGQTVSGDRGTYFKTDDGVLNILLSDGMGTGKEAAMCSESAIRILERFLRAGVPPETAMRILNDLMLLKNETETICATVDLMCVDLFSGETRLYKFGAAPSYVRRGAIVKRLASRSLSAGLGCVPGESPDYVKMKLEPDTFAVIVSDGIAAGDDDGWLRALIAGYEGQSAKVLAKEIISIATSRSGCEDDMTALVLYMEDRP